jgi:hypothetical protein
LEEHGSTPGTLRSWHSKWLLWCFLSNIQAEAFCRQLVSDSTKTQALEEYWEEYGIAQGDAQDYISPQLSPFSVAQKHSRAFSSTTLPTDDRQTLPPFHPALSILECLDTFGPLIFPLHRIALLRKRILLVTSAPVRKACEFGQHFVPFADVLMLTVV